MSIEMFSQIQGLYHELSDELEHRAYIFHTKSPSCKSWPSSLHPFAED